MKKMKNNSPMKSTQPNPSSKKETHSNKDRSKETQQERNTQQQRKKQRNTARKKHTDFNESRAKTVGKAISGFFYFASAMYNFKVVYDNAAPLREKLKQATEILAVKEADLAEKVANLKNI